MKRIAITLEQQEFAALLDLAESDLRNPADELHFILRQTLLKYRLLDNTISPNSKEIADPVNLRGESGSALDMPSLLEDTSK